MQVITMYTVTLGALFWCGGTVQADTEPWIALPVVEYLSDAARCGDLYYLSGDGWAGFYRARDAGPLQDYYVQDWPELDIAADVPQRFARFRGLSTRARVHNISAMARKVKDV